MLFKTIEEFGIVDKNMKLARLGTYITDAEEQYIIKAIGQAQYDDLQEKYDDAPGTPLSEAYEALLGKVQVAVRNMALYIGFPKLNLRISDLGVLKALSNDYESASGGEIYFARIQFLLDGYKALDALLKFLEENKTDYPIWAGDARPDFKKFFINTAEEFNKHVNISESRWLFMQLIQQMELVELLQVKGMLGAQFFNELKSAVITDDLSEEEENLVFGNAEEGILGLVKPIALYTFAASLIDPTVREVIRITQAATAEELSNKGTSANDYARQYADLADRKTAEADALMAHIKRYLNETATDSVFAAYFNSTCYKAPSGTKNILPDYSNDSSETSFAFV